jgi:CDGSH-type Zn-finger protein
MAHNRPIRTDANKRAAVLSARVIGTRYVAGRELRRCGRSSNKPYCDGARKRAGFVDTGMMPANPQPAAGVETGPQQGFTVPKGVLHRTKAPIRSVILMIEGKGVVPTGD